MKRIWILLAALGLVNLVAAGAFAAFIPASAASAVGMPPPVPRPYFLVAPIRPESFERRVRTIAQGEVQQSRPAGGQRLPESADPQRVAARAQRLLQLRDPFAPGAPRPNAGQPPRQATGAVTDPAVLTPFGLFRGGPIGMGMIVLALGLSLAGGALTFYLQPRRMRVLSNALAVSKSRLLRALAAGLLGYLLALVVLFVLVTLVTGVVFAPLVLVVVGAATLMGVVAAGLALGRWLTARLAPQEPAHPITALAVGMLALFPLSLLPWAGWVVALITASVGMGAVLITKFGSENGWSIETFNDPA
ncbi:MAG: hypothetical protein EXR51_00030 [Dehalococcoidia bacterium]|nr:hypothetical protein [Dehalococcoidia bacterium]